MFISSSNQVYYEHIGVVTYSPQNDLSNGVLHVPIGDDLTPTLRGFVVESQIPNLTLDFSFDCNSCISGVIEQCKGILGIYISMISWGFHWVLVHLFNYGSEHLRLLHKCNSQSGSAFGSH
jgi:hypothetical protein